MGMMDDMKKMQEQAAQMTQGVDMSPPSPEEQDRINFHNRVGNEGTPGEGVLKSISETGNDSAGTKEYEIKVDATVNGETNEATAYMYIGDDQLQHYTEGSRWNIKADPGDPSRVVVWTIIE